MLEIFFSKRKTNEKKILKYIVNVIYILNYISKKG